MRNCTLGLSFGLSLLSCASLHADSLLAYFPFEDNYDDGTGNGTTATPVENPDQLSFVDGFRGRSLDINDPDGPAPNTGGKVNIGIDVNPGALPEVTFGGWVNVEGTEFDGFMATDNGGWDRGIAIFANENAFGIMSGTGPTFGGAPDRGTWQYVVGTFSSLTGQTNIYVAGDQPGITLAQVSTGQDLAGAGEPVIELGRYDNQDLDGQVDDIFVFDGALSAAKVNAIRNLRLSALDYSPIEAAALFDLFDTAQTGTVGTVEWSPRADMDGHPGTLIDLGAEGTGIILDDFGSGMAGITGIDFDTDDDGLSDPWELLHFGDLTKTSDGDEDGDGLTNDEEEDAGTDPNNDDSDADGLLDGDEVNTHNSDPLLVDTDGDLYDDPTEVDAGSDPSDPASTPPAQLLALYEFEDNYDDASGNDTLAFDAENPDQLSFVAGFRGQSLDINDPDGNPNSGGRLDIQLNVNPSAMPEVTFGGWVNVEGTEFDGFMATDNGGWDRGIGINAQGDNFSVLSGAGPVNAGAVTRGEWQYVVATFSKLTGEARIYTGGTDILVSSTQVGIGADLAGEGEPVIELGRYDNQDLDGQVDDIFVFSSALSEAKVNAIRNLRISGLDYGPGIAAQLFELFDRNEAGTVAGVDWSLRAGMDGGSGELVDLGVEGTGLILDDLGNGLAGITGLTFDLDGDGLSDDWENLNFGDLSQPGEGDPDGDGLDNLGEQENLTDPNNADSDGDGVNDNEELNSLLTDPLDADSDDDGFSDGEENAAGTDPLDPFSLPPPTLAALYEFEDNYDDSSGNGATAIAGENPDQLSFVDGFRGRSLDVNDPTRDAPGTGGRVDIPINTNPDAMPEVTFGGWVKVEEMGFDGFLATDNGGWDRGIAVNAQASGSFGLVSGTEPTHGGAVTPGKWQFVAATFSRSSGASTLYVGNDGVTEFTTQESFGADLANPPGEVLLEIGRYNNQDLDGQVDDIFVFKGALTSAKVNALRNLRLSGLDYNPAVVAELFALFDANATGTVAEVEWSPRSGLTADPGGLEDLGEEGTGIVLDDLGNGLVGITGLTFDLDDDGLPDDWERLNFGDLSQGPEDDPDEDGLDNTRELENLTDPNNADSDGDGANDGDEINTLLTDPFDPDSDDDGFTDGEEVAAGTDPLDGFSFPNPVLAAFFEFEDNFDDSSGNGTAAAPGQNPDQLSFIDGFRGRSLDINDPDSNPDPALDTQNSGGSVNIALNANPDAMPEVTFGGWVRVEEAGFDGFLATDNGGWDRGIAVNAQASNAFGLLSGAAPVQGGAITPGEWQFVAATFSRSEGTSALYVGGSSAAQLESMAVTGADAANPPGELNLELGRYDNQDLDGAVDDIFVFKGALSAAKVNALRNLRLSELNFSPVDSAALFTLFDAGETGTVGGIAWSPMSDLSGTPGALVDLGAAGTGVILDDGGNGMSGITGIVFDSDGDGMSDTWETENFGDLSRDGTGDEDGDGLTDGDEEDAGTDPNNADGDGDGLSDGDEVNIHGTDPGSADSDDDGYTDAQEVEAGSDPNNANSTPPALLLAYYPFEDSYDDASGNDTPATPSQNPDQLSFVDGFRGRSLDVNDPDANPNSGGSVDISVNANPSAMEEVTFGGWVNVEGIEFDGFMATDNGGWDRGIAVNAQASNAFGVVSGAAPVNGGGISRGEWQFVVGTFSKSTGETRLYVGGPDELNPTTQVNIGADLAAEGEPVIELGRYDNQDLDALVDDIFVFQGALNDFEVNAIRNLRLSAADLSPADAAALFLLFSSGQSGEAGGLNWSPVEGLDATNPGEVFDNGGTFSVVLDEFGNGMRSGGSALFLDVTLAEDGSLNLTWEAQVGKLYNIRSTTDPSIGPPATWPIYDGNEALVGEDGFLMLTTPLPDDLTRLFVVEEYNPPPVTAYAENFDEDDGGWTTGIEDEFGNTSWQHGSPSVVGPGAANSAPNCFGTNLDDNYETDSNIWLRSPTIDLTGAAEATLSFMQFRDIEATFDSGSIKVFDASDDSELGTIAADIWGESNGWEQFTKKLPAAAAGKEVYLEFRFMSDFTQNEGGWYIDDVQVTIP